MRLRIGFWIIVLVLVIGCGTSQPTELQDSRPAVGYYVDGVGSNGICGGSGVHEHSSGVDGTCFVNTAVILLTPVAGNDFKRGIVETAISNWQPRLEEAWQFNVPRLMYAAEGGIPVHFPANTSSDGEFCGTTTPGTGQVTKITLMRLGEGSACTASQRGSLSQVLTHEIAHVLGLNQQHGGVAARSSPLTSTGCTSYLPTGQGYGNLTAQVCYHEVETIIRARSGTGYAYDSSFYSAPLTFSTNVTPRTVSVDAGNSHTFSVSEWYLKPYGSLANGPTSLSWVTFDTTKAKVLAAGVVEGRQGAVGQGPVKVYLRGGALPTGHA